MFTLHFHPTEKLIVKVAIVQFGVSEIILTIYPNIKLTFVFMFFYACFTL